MPVNQHLATERMESGSRYSDEPIGSCIRGIIFAAKIELIALAAVLAAALVMHAIFPN